MPRSAPRRRYAFSLVELVVVVVILGIVSAIAIPRLSRGSEGASEAALIGDLAVMRRAIDMYTAEHVGEFPISAAAFEDQMTIFSNLAGATDPTKGGGFIYGPYLRGLPPLPVGARKGETAVKPPPADGAAGFGWVYNSSDGSIVANTGNGVGDFSAKGEAFNLF